MKTQSSSDDSEVYKEFTDALSELSLERGIGISNGVLYRMEGDDYLFRYFCAEDGFLSRN